jgi:hypothetical protein
MSTIFNCPATKVGRISTVTHVADDIAGLREVTDAINRLTVCGFRFADTAAVLGSSALTHPGVYLLVSRTHVYVGQSSHLALRLLKHLGDETKQWPTEVFVVTAFDAKYFDKAAACYFEQLMIEEAETAGLVKVVNRVNSAGASMRSEEKVSLDRLAEDARRMLYDAGCRIFHSNDPPVVPQSSETVAPCFSESDHDDLGMVPVGYTAVPAGCTEIQLIYGDVWARGFEHESKLVVLPGSDLRLQVNPSVLRIVRDRRERLMSNGSVISVPNNHFRFATAVSFCSATIAARTICGAHVTADLWQPSGRAPLVPFRT